MFIFNCTALNTRILHLIIYYYRIFILKYSKITKIVRYIVNNNKKQGKKYKLLVYSFDTGTLEWL